MLDLGFLLGFYLVGNGDPPSKAFEIMEEIGKEVLVEGG